MPGKAEAGATSGTASVVPSTFIVVSRNDSQAFLPNGADLVVKGAVLLEACHSVAIDGTAGGTGVGIGLSLALALVFDSAQALVGE